LEEDALVDFPAFSLTIVKTRWRALSVSLGSVGYSTLSERRDSESSWYKANLDLKLLKLTRQIYLPPLLLSSPPYPT
jgi:hypothetical protein